VGGKHVLWLRGDRDSIMLYRKTYSVLRAQGYTLEVPSIGSRLEGDLAVFTARASPEHKYYASRLPPGTPSIFEKNPVAALARVIAYPDPELGVLRIGVDPGRRCGVTFVGDGVLFYWEKVECDSLPDIAVLARRIPAGSVEVLLGDGEGLGEAIRGFEGLGFNVGIVEEHHTTSTPVSWSIARMLGDKDLAASLSIALRGGFGGSSRPVWLY